MPEGASMKHGKRELDLMEREIQEPEAAGSPEVDLTEPENQEPGWTVPGNRELAPAASQDPKANRSTTEMLVWEALALAEVGWSESAHQAADRLASRNRETHLPVQEIL